jgi:cytochrome P450
MIIDETLRLYLPACLISRRAVDDDAIGGYRIPAGSTLFLGPYVTQRRPDLWENSEGFHPERFDPERADGHPRYAYFPFGGGPRQCIGNNFALMEATLVVAVAWRYRLDLVPSREVKARHRVTLKPYPGVWMRPRR